MLSVEGFPDSSQFLCMLGLSLLISLVRGPRCRLWIQFQETREDEIFNNSIFFFAYCFSSFPKCHILNNNEKLVV